jgi:hypothetical protein
MDTYVLIGITGDNTTEIFGVYTDGDKAEDARSQVTNQRGDEFVDIDIEWFQANYTQGIEDPQMLSDEEIEALDDAIQRQKCTHPWQNISVKHGYDPGGGQDHTIPSSWNYKECECGVITEMEQKGEWVDMPEDAKATGYGIQVGIGVYVS